VITLHRRGFDPALRLAYRLRSLAAHPLTAGGKAVIHTNHPPHNHRHNEGTYNGGNQERTNVTAPKHETKQQSAAQTGPPSSVTLRRCKVWFAAFAVDEATRSAGAGPKILTRNS
jgi:hypothetical protein